MANMTLVFSSSQCLHLPYSFDGAGNQSLSELVFAFTGCPQSVTGQIQQPIPQYFAAQVLPAFEQALVENNRLKYDSISKIYRTASSEQGTFTYKQDCRPEPRLTHRP